MKIRYYEIINPEDLKKFYQYRMLVFVLAFVVFALFGMLISWFATLSYGDAVGADLRYLTTRADILLLLAVAYLVYKEFSLRNEVVTFFDNRFWYITTFFMGKKVLNSQEIVQFVVREKSIKFFKFNRGVYSVNIWHKRPGQLATLGGFMCFCDKMFLEVLEQRFPGKIAILK